jgi:hypothetical protein
MSVTLVKRPTTLVGELPPVAVDEGRIVLGPGLFLLGRMADTEHAGKSNLFWNAQSLSDGQFTLRLPVAAQQDRPQPEPGGRDEDVLRRESAVLQPTRKDGISITAPLSRSNFS